MVNHQLVIRMYVYQYIASSILNLIEKNLKTPWICSMCINVKKRSLGLLVSYVAMHLIESRVSYVIGIHSIFGVLTYMYSCTNACTYVSLFFQL